MLNIASYTPPRDMPGSHTFSWNKRADTILKKWKSVFEASVVDWTVYWYYEENTGVLRLLSNNEGMPTQITPR